MNNDIVMNNTTETPSVAVKVVKGEEMRRFNFKSQSFEELKKIISEIFNISEQDFFLQYQDDEKDRVTLSSDAELKEAIQIHKYVLRFFVVVTKPAAGENNPPFPHPHPPHHHHHHHRGHHGHGPHGHGPNGAEVVVVEGDATVPSAPTFGRHGPHGHPFGPFPGHGPNGRPFGPGPHGHGPHRHHGHGPHGHHKRRYEKEDKEAMKCERKRWKKQRKCESSSSSEDEAQKMQKKEMKQLMKATKQSIKANWAPIKEANPAQWSENRELMIAEIKMAKRIIREQANKPTTPVVAVAEQNPSVVTAAVEMQA